jgi:hypothetical protein
MSKHVITIAGNIGVGKSTLVQLLSEQLGWEPVFEAVAENPYLAAFCRAVCSSTMLCGNGRPPSSKIAASTKMPKSSPAIYTHRAT